MIFQEPTPKEYVVCRELGGQLTRNGEPLANVTITRTLSWNGNEDGQKDSFTTDANGNFSIPAHSEVLALNFMTEYVGKSRLEVDLDGQAVIIWNEGLRREKPESIGNITQMSCEVTGGRERVNSGSGLLGTVCKWGDMPEEEDPYAL